ncbi:FecCD family ABC transporter permease [Amorphus sp. 3PC139-8]|uniref:FecCD family ABC transporter permease n=1 Tax=Amorphus sp. 3PC139-8 TaxID=2735676 RepID=UPI00345CAF2F
MSRALILMVAATVLLFAVALGQGDQALTPGEIAGALLGDPTTSPVASMIVMEVRLPRALLALLVGVALGVAGAIAQTVMRNPLAEPGLLGINGGAAFAAIILIVGFGLRAPTLLPWCAFAGAFAMALAIYLLSWRNGASSIRIILIGIGLSSLAGAAISFVSAFGDVAAVQRAQVWLAGSVYDARWEKVTILAAWLVIPLGATFVISRELDLIGFGESSARGLGQRVHVVGALAVLMCTILSAAAVAAAGLIGFVGLIAPHIARRLVGHRHLRLLPAAGLVGAALVLAADLIGRTVIAPAQLPAGLVTTLIGAPFFGFLLWRRRHVAG